MPADVFVVHAALERARLARLAVLREKDRVAGASDLAFANGARPAWANVPNAITLSGYAAGIAWAAGGAPILAVWSVLADELDGVSARNLGVASPIGDRLDWGVDVVMLALVGVKIGLGWVALPALLLGQVVLKERGVAPPFGSTRAAAMAFALR